MTSHHLMRVVRRRRLTGRTASVLLLALLLAGCSLSAPPPAREGAPLLTPIAQQPDVPVELPTRKPSAVNGAAIYAEKCAGCHGPIGRGDGERAAQIQQQVGVPPADLTADTVARASTPAEWYAVITAGRIERLMPPFSGSLSADDRWDVIAYVWSLGSPETVLERGQAIYAGRCAACHGETGKGDGPQAEGKLIDLSDLVSYTGIAPGEWDNAINTTHVPTFNGKLDAAERAAVIDYVRSFTYDTAAVADVSPAATSQAGATPAATARPPATAVAGVTINGSVVNGTNGAAQPGNLEGMLYYFPGGVDNAGAPITRTLTIDAEGRFSVSDLKAQAGDELAANVVFGDITYWSDVIALDGAARTVEAPIRVYEQTVATDAIQIDNLHVIVTADGGALDVIEVHVISNLGDRSVANTSGQPTLNFGLPAGATGFQGMSSTPGVYAPTAEGFGYFEAVLPGAGSTQVTVRYQLPMNGDVVLDRALTYPVSLVNLLVQGGDLKPSGSQLIDQGVQEFQGQTFELFSGGPFPAGQTLSFRLVGPASVDVKLIAAAALLVVGVAGIGWGLWRRQREQAPQPAAKRKPVPRAQAVKVSEGDREALIDQIAALDNAFTAGEMAEAD
ncbi:MAG TPA: c-type cytochrome, partial [Anaerolineae bacterium]|nr:c-type cytochrome [Anaerolineae bacterium]